MPLLALLLRAPGAGAIEPAFVVNQATNDVSVVDLQTAAVSATWATPSSPRAIAIAPNDLALYVATRNRVTALDVLRPGRRVEFELQSGLIDATSVAVSREGNKVFVTHFTNITSTLALVVTMIDLQHPTVAACLRDRTDPCIPGAGEILLSVPFAQPKHVAVSPWDGSVWVVSTDGRIARAATPGAAFVEVPTAVNQRPRDPGGMSIGHDGNVAIAANGNCAVAGACVKVVVPAMANMLVTRNESFLRLGRVLVGAGGPVFVAAPMNNLIARIAAGPQQNFPTAPNPVGVGVGALGTLYSVNENTAPGNGTVSVIGSGMPRSVTVGSLPGATVASPRVMRGMIRAETRSVSWTYTNPFGWVGTPVTVQFRNRGFESLTVQGINLVGNPGVFGPGPVNFSIAGNTCIGATLAFQQTCDVTVGFRSSPTRFPFPSGDFARLSLQSSDATHGEVVTLTAGRPFP
jgi:DNA-binding beta-propeller fold protein YncE